MKKSVLKVIAIAMVTAAISCVGAGCTGTVNISENKDESGITASFEVDEASQKTESKQAGSETVSEEESSKQDKDTKTGNQSEKKTESRTESKKDGKTESKTESKDNKDSIKKSDIIGEWEYSVGGNYIGMTLSEDGVAQIAADEVYNTMFGTWEIAGSQVKVTVYGADSFYDYVNGCLINADARSQVFFKCSEDDEDDALAEEIVGEWVYNIGDEYMAMAFAEDGTVMIRANEVANTMHGTWTVSGTQVKVTVYGGDNFYNYIDKTLVNADAPSQVFLKTGENYSPENNNDETNRDEVIGTWEYNVGSNYIGMTLFENGSVHIESTESDEIEYGTWSIDKATVTVVMVSGTKVYTYDGSNLIDVDDPGHVFFRG